ncbi:isoamylase early set domain-containing protein [Flavimarina sp. Hel_I_48]|uniref:isoamylase early set domain-containing protein n=1 Tax=Flavimarina sp. Hel_I_48 TaxID=1392488 RepID=UPI0004DF7CE1|nr:isoamylase early set domain-containing protein [Flavimarina sp. Hel_I_48]
MAIKKLYLKSKPECKVTFTLPAENAEKVIVLGDFNNWDPSEDYQLKKLKNGNFKGTINLPAEQTYQFRYLVDSAWVNDSEADRYQWNDFADAENSVLEL